jgi:CspA family cold shock protein
MEGGTRKTGSVKWFSRVKGYGFIAPDDQEKEIFVHFSGIDAEGYRNLEQGQRVTFEVEETPKGPQAVHVTIVASDAEAPAQPEEKPADVD